MGATNILGLTSDELRLLARVELSSGAGFAHRIYSDAMRRGRYEPAGLGASVRSAAAWRSGFVADLPKVVRVVEEPAADDRSTEKAALRTHDGLEIECVRVPMARGSNTLCLSSQIGCKMGCRFCETGSMGFLRDLTAAEIVGQVVTARTALGWPIKNIVFMGMGEPLDNVENVIQALRVLNDPRGLGYGQQRITVCTVGHEAGLSRLGALGWRRLNVAISLNAATDAVRDDLMPINRKTPLEPLLQALRRYRPRDNFAYAVNYCLLPGINDSRADAAEVAAFCAPLGRALVNVIPYNPGRSPITRAPDDDDVRRFIGWLEAAGVPVRGRVTKGRSVMAGCGQLGNRDLRDAARPAGGAVASRSDRVDDAAP